MNTTSKLASVLVTVSTSVSSKKMFTKLKVLSKKEVIFFWLATILTILSYGTQMNYAPFLYSDEMVNVELGRIFLAPQTDWSIVWLSEKGHPVLLISYLGVVAQELIFQWFGTYTVRVLTLLGAGFAAFSLFRFLRQLEIPNTIALLSGLLLLWDPVFVQSYTKGRMDSWALTACLYSCILIQQSFKPGDSFSRKTLLFAGGLAVLALFIWPSAGFLLPLLLIIFLNGIFWKKNGFTKLYLGPTLWLTTGSILTLALLLVPIFPVILPNFDRLLDGIQYNLKSGDTAQTVTTSKFIENLSEYFRLMRFSPVVLLLGLLGLIMRGNRHFFLAFMFALAMASVTLIYINRVIYLLPYLYIGFAYFAHWFQQFFPKYKLLNKSPIYGAISWSLLISIGAWNVLANSNNSFRERANLSAVTDFFALPPESRVLCFSYEFYYLARKNKWKSFTPYHIYNEPVTASMVGKVLPLVKYVIVPDAVYMEKNTANLLQVNGFHPTKSAGTGRIITTASWEKLWISPRLRNLFGLPIQPYASYTLFERQQRG